MKWKPAGVVALVIAVVLFLDVYTRSISVVVLPKGLEVEGDRGRNRGTDEDSKASVNACAMPPNGYKAWNTGLVTGLGSPIIKDCSKIIAGDKRETENAKQGFKSWLSIYSDQYYSKGAEKSLLQQSSQCSWLKETLSNNLYNTKMEREFPIAYIFLVYESPLQFLRLFRILHKPQNTYCIHVDSKSFYRNFYSNFAKCLDNVVIASKLSNVQWSVFTMMDAQMQCFTDLVNLREKQREEKKWRYVVNLCSKELPLHTTKEMVKMMQAMKGTSSIYARPIPKSEYWTMKRLRQQPIPYNLTYYKSMAYNALSADFATFMVKDHRAQRLYKFFRNTDFPEEHLYAVLFHVPEAPGGYDPDLQPEEYFEVGHYFWRTNEAGVALPCFGVTVHGICVVNHGDLPRIMRETKDGKTALFHNKYFMELDHVAMDCMEEMIVFRNRKEYEEDCL